MWDLESYEHNEALIDENGRVVTYGELDAFSRRFCGAAGGRTMLFILCTNSVGSVSGYVSCINGRIVPALLSAGIDADLLERLLETYEPALLWCPKEHALTQRYRCVFSEYDYCLLETGYSREYGLFPDLALLLTTSGSTGSPKFVRQSYENIRSNAAAIAEYLRIGADERPISTLPMNYTYGLSIINSHLLKGAALLLTEAGILQKDFWRMFREKGATSFGGVPYTYEMLLKLRFFRMELPRLRYFTQAGGKLPPEVHRQFAEYAQSSGKKFIVMYGQCEATARMAYLPAERSLEKYGSMGIPIPGGRFRLVDANGGEIDRADTVGELVYEGPNVTLGYAEKKADLLLGDERGGVLQTGDMAKRDEDGFYYIVGRKKRFLKVYGNRLNLDEAEMLLRGRFPELECAVGGVDDHVYVFVEGGEDMAPEIRSYFEEKTGLNKKAFTVRTIDELPKNEAGKLLYRELEKYYLE